MDRIQQIDVQTPRTLDLREVIIEAGIGGKAVERETLDTYLNELSFIVLQEL